MAYVERLVCSRCGREYEPGAVMCDSGDRGRLDVHYDYEAVKEALSKETLEKRAERGVWRYWELLPVDASYAVRLGEGDTPLVRAGRLAERLGLRKLYLKDETQSPTSSFKDRAMTVGVAKAVELEKKMAVTASSGNAAASLAAYTAKAGIGCIALVPEDASAGKIAQLLLYGARVFRLRQVEEGVDPTVELMVEAARSLGWYPCPSFGPYNPYQVEGLKTISFELVEQLGWEPPDVVLIPTGSGCLAAGVWKGFRDLLELGLIDEPPRLVPVQPEGNPALVDAINRGIRFEEIKPTPYPRSVASGLLDPFPWDGDAVIEGVKATGGKGVLVSDEEIMEAVKLLAGHEGIFAEPSGAAGLAGLRRLVEEGWVSEDEKVVVLVTGSGLKESEKILGLYPEPPLIEPRLESLKKLLG